jgi:hypothetical protein
LLLGTSKWKDQEKQEIIDAVHGVVFLKGGEVGIEELNRPFSGYSTPQTSMLN